MRLALAELPRYIATVETAKHRIFVWLPASVAPEHKLVVIARSDDAVFGVLSSRIHVVWALAVGARLEDRPVYTSSLCFDAFPFPEGFNLRDRFVSNDIGFGAIAKAAHDLDAWRESWLNPKEWVDWAQTEEEKLAGFPSRGIPTKARQNEWEARTLTDLYNSMPSKLRLLHEALDGAVAQAYGWSDYTDALPDEEILRRLLALNLQRA